MEKEEKEKKGKSKKCKVTPRKKLTCFIDDLNSGSRSKFLSLYLVKVLVSGSKFFVGLEFHSFDLVI